MVDRLLDGTTLEQPQGNRVRDGQCYRAWTWYLDRSYRGYLHLELAHTNEGSLGVQVAACVNKKKWKRTATDLLEASVGAEVREDQWVPDGYVYSIVPVGDPALEGVVRGYVGFLCKLDKIVEGESPERVPKPAQ